jgi:hypothetical protein
MISRSKLDLPVEFGNTETTDTHGSGWFIGFSDWSKHEPHHLRHIPNDAIGSGLCVKWFAHKAGDPKGQDKPVSSGRTISILVSEESDFRIEFCFDSSFEPEITLSYRLQRKGDFVIWGAGVYHRAFGHQASTIMSLRWETK